MRHGLDFNNQRHSGSLFNLFSEFDQLFNEAFRTPVSVRGTSAAQSWLPRFETSETEDAYFLSMDLPGVKKEDIKVDVNGRELAISGQRRQIHKVQSGTEDASLKFERRFAIPEGVDVGQFEAHLEDGILTLALPKLAVEKPRTIEIQSGQSGFFSKLLGGGKKDLEKKTH